MNLEFIKNWLKQFRLIYYINAFLKSHQLKYRSNKITKKYNKKFLNQGFFYDELSAINSFKEKHLQLKPNFYSKKHESLNIFWVGASEAQDNSGFIQALGRIGKVTKFFNHDGGYGPFRAINNLDWIKVREINDEDLIRQVTIAHEQDSIDFLIGQMWAHLLSERALLKVRSLGIPIINISMDDRLPNLWQNRNGYRVGAVGLSSGVDLTLTTSPEVCKWYAAENMPALFWPLASDDKLFLCEDYQNKDIDILFIGNRYGIRGSIVEYLLKQNISVDCYGNGWPNGYVNAEQNISLSKRAKIILGVGSIGHCDDIFTLKLRDFDALMTGALYITHRNPDLKLLFQEGKHLECYSSMEELALKLKYFLANPNKCIEIGTRGNALAKKEHTWDFRLSSTFLKIGLIS